MFEDGGESLGTGAARCPGNSCPHFYQASGATAAKRHDNARRQCGLNCSPPKVERCPGEDHCGKFSIARSEGDGLAACQGCALLPTKPGDVWAVEIPAVDAKSEAETAEDLEAAEVENLVDEIADIVFWEDAASLTDWTLYPFEYRMLYAVWREAERKVRDIRERRMQTFIKSFWGDE